MWRPLVGRFVDALRPALGNGSRYTHVFTRLVARDTSPTEGDLGYAVVTFGSAIGLGLKPFHAA
jgi:hypothetical protein